MELGYALSSEEHAPADLVRYARLAEDSGFSFAVISDHFHPWTSQQGQSGFVWSVLGAIAQATERIWVSTGVTCPMIRIHPAIIAQAAATVASLMPGRFVLGVGTGENLNEHILGDYWPSYDIRLEMLEEAVEVIRALWRGGLTSHHGVYYTVENARLYSLPDAPPPIYMAASGPKSLETAGRISDGLIAVAPSAEIVRSFRQAGGDGKPTAGQVMVCYAGDEAEARRVAHRWWPNAALSGQLGQDLALPSHFEAATALVTEDHVAEAVVCGPDAQRHIDKIGEFVDAGFEHVYVHQVGPDQEAFFRFYAEHVLPAFTSL